jgi:hypothetical protein
MAGQHDDRHVGIGVGARLADHLHQFEAVEDRHHPVGDDNIRTVLGERFQSRRAVFGLIHFARAEAVQQRAHDAPHMRVVVDDEETQPIEIDADHNNPQAAGTAAAICGRKVRFCR